MKKMGLHLCALLALLLICGCGSTSTRTAEPFFTPTPTPSRSTMEFVSVPAGEFTMGLPGGEGYSNENPQHVIYLDAYEIGKYEVTNAQYSDFVTASGYSASGNWRDADGELPGYASEYPDYPVVSVTWNDARAFCDYYGWRLPTEAEWEKAARGTDGRKFPWGNYWGGDQCNHWGYPIVSAMANLAGAGRGTLPVGYIPIGESFYGCQDMSGNVWEWCNDWYLSNYYSSSPSSNPKGPGSGYSRVLRGGSWYYLYKFYYSATARGDGNPNFGDTYVGFRVAR